MPIVTAHCRILDGQGRPEANPQVFLKVKGKFFRTPYHLKKVYKCEGGWTGSSIHYRAELDEKTLKHLRTLAEIMLNTYGRDAYALDGTGLKHCGIRFVF